MEGPSDKTNEVRNSGDPYDAIDKATDGTECTH